MATLENKVLRKKKIDKELSLKVTKNDAAERIFVEFSSKDGKMVLQRSFQDTFHGRTEAGVFEESIKSINELVAHFERNRR